jgi:hypothetical protein
MNDNELIYPIVFDYASKWGVWEAVRELVSNAYDSDPKFTMDLVDNTLVIEDHGCGIELPQLLMGEHESGDNSIGQFGEGLKIALLVLIRSNHPTEIHSNNLVIKASSGTKFGKDVLKVTWEETTPREGTCVYISDWEGNTFQDRFIFDPKDFRVMATTTSGSVLYGNPTLYNKGVYVNSLDGYEFGYNFFDLDMNRDRSVVSENEVRNNVAKVWAHMTNSRTWAHLFKSVDKGSLEKEMSISYWSCDDRTKNAVIEGWAEAFGDNAVIRTDDNWEREAKHCNAEIINGDKFGYSFYNFLCNIVKTDKQWVMDKHGVDPKPVKLNAEQKKILTYLKKKALKVGYEGEIVVMKMMNGMGGQTNQIDKIILDINFMNDQDEALGALIHELAHNLNGARDMTEEHAHDIALIGARMSR